MSRTIGHIVVLGTQPEWLSGLRGPLIRDFLARGYRVTAIGAEEMASVRAKLESWGAEYAVVPLRRAGLNPLSDLRALLALYRTLRRLKPDLLFAYTVKPIVYGLPAAWAARVPRRYAMIAGRGYAFHAGPERSRRLARLAGTVLVRFAFRFADGVLFHNNEDLAYFRDNRILGHATRARRIWGSGVDLDHHRPVEMPPLRPGQPVRFLMIGRLIRDKGVREYAAAARTVKRESPATQFILAGPTDPSPNGISASELDAIRSDGAVDYVGPLDDVRAAIAQCHVVVLPSYYEGLPRSVLEGMAAGRAIITTYGPGCADTVEPGVSGLLVPPRDAEALAEAMRRCIADPAFVAAAGRRSLELARDKFDVERVNADIADFLGIEAPPRGCLSRNH